MGEYGQFFSWLNKKFSSIFCTIMRKIIDRIDSLGRERKKERKKKEVRS